MVFAHVVADLLSDPIAFLQADSNSALLALFDLALAAQVRLSLVACCALTHLDSPDATIGDCGVCRLSGHSLFAVRVAQQVGLCISVGPA